MLVKRVDYCTPGISWAVPGYKYKVYTIYFLGVPVYTRRRELVSKKPS